MSMTRSWRLVGALLLGAMGGCQSSESFRVRVVTEPPGAAVAVRDTTGKTVQSKVAPFDATLRFPEAGGTYVLEGRPAPKDAERYLDSTVTQLTLEQVKALPGSGHARELKLELREKEFVNVPTLIIILDPQQGWRGIVTRRRGYQNITELGGRSPQRVSREFAENEGLRGMTITPVAAGAREAVIVYALASSETAVAPEMMSAGGALVSIERCTLQGVMLSGGGTKVFTQEQYRDVDPTFSPDGKYICFASNRRRTDSSDIFRMLATARAGGMQTIYSEERGAMITNPSVGVNGEGEFIAFDVYPDGWTTQDEAQIWTKQLPSGFPTQVALGVQPQVSPDGMRIAYIFKGDLYVCYADGTAQTRLTSDADEIARKYSDSLSDLDRLVFQFERERSFSPYSYPTWTPDGHFIIYTSMEGVDDTGRPNEDIWVREVDGSFVERLTFNPSADRYPLVSSDGRSIYFFSNRGKRWAIWRIDMPDLPGTPR